MRKLTIIAVSLVAALLVALYSAPPGVAQVAKVDKQQPPIRKKWEYKVVRGDSLFELAKDDKEWKKVQEKLEKANINLDEFAARLLEFVLNKLGDDGWELIGYPRKDKDPWVFKRVK